MFKKSIITGMALLTSLSSSGLAQSVDFNTTYNNLIDQVVSESTLTPTKPTDALASQGSTNISISSNEIGISVSAQIGYNQIIQQKKSGTYAEGNINLDTNISLSMLDELSIRDLKIQGNIDFKLTPTTAFLKINSLSFNTSALPADIKSDVDTMIAAFLSKAQNKWIRILLPKELRDELKSGQEFSPQAIITLLKQYPLVKNAGYKNNAFSVQLDTDHIMELLEKYDLIGSEEEYKSMLDQQSYEVYLQEQKNNYPDTFKSESEFNVLTYPEYINLFEQIHAGSLILTFKQQRELMKAFDTNSKEFVSLVKIIFPQDYIATDEDLADESIIQYLKEYYTEEFKTYTLEEVWYYDDILSAIVIPTQSKFEKMSYDTFLSDTYDIDNKEDFLVHQKDWNEYVEEHYNPETVKQEFKSFLNSLPVQGTLSTTDSPTLQLTTKATEDFPLNSSLSINNNTFRISGELKQSEDYGDGDKSSTITKFSTSLQSHNNTLHYALDLSVIDTSSWYEPSSFLLKVSGNESYSIQENYQFIRPKGAISGNRLFSSFDL